jgi:transposase
VDKTQDSKRRHFSPHEKVAVFKRHLLERVPISAICEELKISPNMFYRWPQELFENAHLSFETDRKSKAIEATKDRRIAAGSQDRKTNPALKGWATIGSRYATTRMRGVNPDLIICVCPNNPAPIRALFGLRKARQFLPTTSAPFVRLRSRSDNRR